MKQKMITILAVLCLVATFSLVSCKGKNAKAAIFKIGYANPNDAVLFDKLKHDTFEKLAKEDPSLEVVYTNANSDVQLQLDHVDNFIAQKMNLIILDPVNGDGIVPGIERANAAGIPVMCLGFDATGGDFIYVGTKHIEAGIMQGQYMAEHLPPNANVLYLAGRPGHSNSIGRREGFLSVISAERPDVTILAEQTGHYMRDQGMTVMEDWIQIYPKIDAVVAANDEMAMGALEALKSAGRHEGVLIAGVDATDEACLAVKNGEMAITILQSAPKIVQKGFETAKKLQNGESVEKEIIISFEKVTIENVDQLL